MGYVPNIPGVTDGFGGQNFLGQQYLSNFSNWGIGGSPDVPSIGGIPSMANMGGYSGDIPQAATAAVPGAGGFLGDMWSGFKNAPWLNSKDVSGIEQQGILSPAISGLAALGNGFLAMKQYGLAEKQFDFQKQAFNQNFAAQRQATNSQLEDRQRARVSSNPNAYESVGDYMAKNGIK